MLSVLCNEVTGLVAIAGIEVACGICGRVEFEPSTSVAEPAVSAGKTLEVVSLSGAYVNIGF